METRRLGLSVKQKKAIQSSYVHLLEHLRFVHTDVIDRLFASNIFTESMKEDIEYERTPRNRIAKLLNMVMCSDNPDAFKIFTDALDEASLHHVSRMLSQSAAEAELQRATPPAPQALDGAREKRSTFVSTRHMEPVEYPDARPSSREAAATLIVCQERHPASKHPVLYIPPSGNETGTKVPESSTVSRAPETPTSPGWKESWKKSFEAGTARQQKDGSRISFKKHPLYESPNFDLIETQAAPSGGEPLSQRLRAMKLRDVSSPKWHSQLHRGPATELDDVSRVSSVGASYTVNRVEPGDDANNSVIRVQITLQREPDESFGFKFVSGLGSGRARFTGDRDYYISDIIPNTIAARSGSLHKNDTIVSVNGEAIRDLQYNTVIDMFQKLTRVTLIAERYTDYDVCF